MPPGVFCPGRCSRDPRLIPLPFSPEGRSTPGEAGPCGRSLEPPDERRQGPQRLLLVGEADLGPADGLAQAVEVLVVKPAVDPVGVAVLAAVGEAVRRRVAAAGRGVV